MIGWRWLGCGHFATIGPLYVSWNPTPNSGSRMGHSGLIKFDDRDSRRWAGGEWEGCIPFLIIPHTHHNSPQCLGDSWDGLRRLLGFDDCTVMLSDGLDEIGEETFRGCMSLIRIIDRSIDLLTTDMTMEWRSDSLSMTAIIIQNVLSFF